MNISVKNYIKYYLPAFFLLVILGSVLNNGRILETLMVVTLVFLSAYTIHRAMHEIGIKGLLYL